MTSRGGYRLESPEEPSWPEASEREREREKEREREARTRRKIDRGEAASRVASASRDSGLSGGERGQQDRRNREREKERAPGEAPPSVGVCICARWRRSRVLHDLCAVFDRRILWLARRGGPPQFARTKPDSALVVARRNFRPGRTQPGDRSEQGVNRAIKRPQVGEGKREGKMRETERIDGKTRGATPAR